MRIGFSGRVGVGLILFAVIADAVAWLVRAFDDYQFDFYRQSDAYLPVIFLFGLALLSPSISIAIQAKRAANLAKFPLTAVGPLPLELRQVTGQIESRGAGTGTGPVESKEIPPPKLAFVPSPSHRKLFLWLGCICLLLSGLVYASAQWWMGTLTFVPLDIALSIDHGHIRTAEFQTDFRAVYSIDLTLPYSNDPSCGFRSGPWPPIPWKLLRSGRPVAEGTVTKPYWYYDEALGRVEVPKGLYSLEIDLPASCTSVAEVRPKLAIEADRHTVRIDNIADWLFYMLAGLGITLVLWPDVRESEELSLQGETRATYRGMAEVDRTLQPLIPIRKPLFLLRVWSPAWFTILAVLWIIFATITPLTPRGLKVNLPQPGTFARADEPWNEPVVLHIDEMGNLYLNLQPIPPSALEKRLRETLRLRADWRVYVDGDPDANTGDVIWAVDILQGMGIQNVLLVTPSIKKEKPAAFAIPPCEIRLLQDTNLPFPPRGHRYGAYYPLVSFVVSARGEVSKSKILKSSGDAEIDKWAANSALRWKYTPKLGCGSRVLEKEFSAYYYDYRY